MATIPMTGGFTLCPEGIHIFRIYDCTYDVDFGKVEVKMVNAQGITYTERFNLIGNGGVMNEGACNAFSYFAKTALNNYTLEEIDHTWLIDRYIKVEIVHNVQPKKDKPGETVTFVNSGNKWVAEKFDTEPVPKALTLGKNIAPSESVAQAQTPAPTATQPTTTSSFNLDELLGG